MAAAAEVEKPIDKDQPTSPANVRKRRRRVPTTGASEDCHSCRKRVIKCDRRRPYCSQCLEIKKDCSGYRTTLTWGVGVASRGKLRGMSLPIAKPPGGQEPNKPAAPQNFVRPRANTMQTPPSSTFDANGQDGPRKRVRLNPLQTDVQTFHHPSSPSTHQSYYQNNYNGVGSFGNWQQTAYPPHVPSQQFTFESPFNFNSQQRRSELFPLHTAVGTSFSGLPWSPNTPASGNPSPVILEDMSPFANYPRAPGMPPAQQTLPSQSVRASPTMQRPHRTSPQSHYQTPPPAPPVSNGVHFDTLPPSSSFPQQHQHQHQQPTSILGSNDGSDNKQGNDMNARPNFKRAISAPEVAPSDQSELQDASPQDQPSTGTSEALISNFQPRMNPPPIMNISSRIWSLLEYYDRNICPVLVTFDNDENPYRKHIMQLALQNSGLQNALAALVTNNIRMRCLKEVPDLTDNGHKTIIRRKIGMPTAEEQHYKAKSIDFLNSQLADTTKAVDDSVLATLLILCLFHVCDSGFSKFKTQLAGVQKLLRMRSGLPRNEFHGWVEMFFAWFDVMTSAVNDRETEIQGQVLDLMDLSNNLGSVEEFSGCDGKLFKLIARLGRLNLLSQRRSVRALNKDAISPLTSAPRRVDSALDFFSLPTEQFDVDTEWENVLSQKDEFDWDGTATKTDDRDQFWAEWHELQGLLYAWENTRFDGMSFETPDLSEGQRAMLHMSESFRWAALLYLERLANPTMTSSSANLQHLVKKSLDHIRDIGTNSCVTKFMLWPLFISGTECVDKGHRDLIRERSIEILQESGFYNNVSGLEVLERVWKKHDEEEKTRAVPPVQCGQQAFHWRSCMDRVDGEYIVI